MSDNDRDNPTGRRVRRSPPVVEIVGGLELRGKGVVRERLANPKVRLVLGQ